MSYANRNLIADLDKPFIDQLLSELNKVYEPRFNTLLLLEDFEILSLEANETDRLTKGNTKIRLSFNNRFLLGEKDFFYQRLNVGRLSRLIDGDTAYLGLFTPSIAINEGTSSEAEIAVRILGELNRILGLGSQTKIVLAADYTDPELYNDVLFVIDSIVNVDQADKGWRIEGRIVDNPFWVCDIKPTDESSENLTKFKVHLLEAELNYFLADTEVEAFVNPTFLLAPKVRSDSFLAYPSEMVYKTKSTDTYSLYGKPIYLLVKKPSSVYTLKSLATNKFNPSVNTPMFKDVERN